MRIPRYEQQVGVPNAPQITQIADVRNDNLSGLADSLDEIYQVKLREQEEAKKTAFFQADTSIKMAMDKAMFDIQERIQNGGSYANAEKEYQKAHDAAIKQFGAAFDADESGNVRMRSMAEYQSLGLSNLLRLRDKISSRRRSDATSAANNRLDLLKREYALAGTPQEKEAAMQKITGTMAGLSASGVIDGNTGKQKLREILSGAEADRISLFAQNNADNPQAVLDEVEKSKDLLSVDSYIQMRGAAMNRVDEVATVERVDKFLSGDNSAEIIKKPKAADIDFYYQEKIATIEDPIEYSKSIVSLAQKTGRMPTQIVGQADAFFNIDPLSASASDLQTVEQLSNIIAESSKFATVKDSSVPPEISAKANIIRNRVVSGIPVKNALAEMQKVTSGGEYEETYKSARKEANKILLQKDKKIKTDVPQWSLPQFVDSYSIYRSEGATQKEATKLAEEEIFSRFDKFNGKKFQDPVTLYEPYKEKTWVNMAEQALAEKGIEKSDDVVLGVVADPTTKKQIARGEDATYVIVQYNGETLPPTVVLSKNGNPLRLKANPSMKRTEFNLYGNDTKKIPFGGVQ